MSVDALSYVLLCMQLCRGGDGEHEKGRESTPLDSREFIVCACPSLSVEREYDLMKARVVVTSIYFHKATLECKRRCHQLLSSRVGSKDETH